MKKIIILFLIFSFQQISAQEELNNQSIIDLIELGFDESVIVAKIEASTTNFDTSIDKLKELKNKGVSPTVLTAMIKSSKKKDVEDIIKKKVSNIPKPDDAEFYWLDGYNNLVKVNFVNSLPLKNSISDNDLGAIVNEIMAEAKFSLNNSLSFIPRILIIRERVKGDKILTKKDNTSHVALLTYLGKNAYGSESEEILLIGFNPTLDLNKPNHDNSGTNKINYKTDTNKIEFRYDKVIMHGKKTKMSGGFVMGKNYLVIITDETKYSPRMEEIIKIEKIYEDDNNWTATYSDVVNDVNYSMKFSYDRNNNKYKNDGGVLTLESMGTIIEYLLIKM